MPQAHSMKNLTTEQISKSITEMLLYAKDDPNELAELSAFLGRFHQYSQYNKMLIYRQRPDTIQVNGKTKWEELGRKVMSKEKSHPIIILRPHITHRTTPVYDANGTKIGEDVQEVHAGYVPCKVYAYEQTTGKTIEIKTLQRVDATDPVALKDRLVRTATVIGVTVNEQDLPFTERGGASKRTITVNRLHDPASQCAEIMVGLGHIILDHENEKHDDMKPEEKDTEAELTAMIVSLSLGYNPTGSAGLIRQWHVVDHHRVVAGIKASDAILTNYRQVP